MGARSRVQWRGGGRRAKGRLGCVGRGRNGRRLRERDVTVSFGVRRKRRDGERTFLLALGTSTDVSRLESLDVLLRPPPHKRATRTANRMNAPMQLDIVSLNLGLPFALPFGQRSGGSDTLESDRDETRSDSFETVDVLGVDALELAALLQETHKVVCCGCDARRCGARRRRGGAPLLDVVE